ncbi:MAG: acyltransferase family protein, partial [Clostridia bacterium]|nr:acyltransferase family protein [Clostridia bacterium]
MKNNPKATKNSLIELMRFFFALWVLYYHGYFPHRVNGFNDGFLAVEFFFVLSGFYLVRSIDKYVDLPLKNGLLTFLKHRFLPIAAPFLINIAFSVYYCFKYGSIFTNDLFGYLWYVRTLFLWMAIIFISRKYIKNQITFYFIWSALSVASLILFLVYPPIDHVGELRALIAIPLGMLVALIPKIKPQSNENFWSKMPALLIAIGVVSSILVCLQIAYMPKTKFIQYFLKIIVYPVMLYFASCVNFSLGFFNWLGSLSFPIYAFQCVLRVLETNMLTNVKYQFALIVAMVLIFSLVDAIIK